MENAEALLGLSNFPDEATARRIVRELVEAKVVACGNIIPSVESIYRWQGKVETSAETLVLFKLAAAGYAAFEERLKSLHPYEVPEIICVKISAALPGYLRWIAEVCPTQRG